MFWVKPCVIIKSALPISTGLKLTKRSQKTQIENEEYSSDDAA